MDIHNNQVPIVSIAVVSYNHSKYIRDCLDSILNQKVNFKFEIVIGDDFSLDNTLTIVNEYKDNYPHIIKVLPSLQNEGILKNLKKVLDSCSGKYISVCASDDFYSDQNKLQIQFDCLESNTEYGLVHSDCDIYWEIDDFLEKNHHRKNKHKISEGHIFNNLLSNNFILTPTVFFCSDLYRKYINLFEFQDKGFLMEDYPMWLELSMHTKIRYINKSLVTYRIRQGSLSHPTSIRNEYNMFQSYYNVKFHFITKYGANIDINNLNLNYHKQLLNYSFLLRIPETAHKSFNYLKSHNECNLYTKLKLIGSLNYFFNYLMRVVLCVKNIKSN